jgi:citronellol/citronellal dehydrogenase
MVIFVTGRSRGIRLAISKRAVRDGAKIVIAAKTTEENPKLPGSIYTAANEIGKLGVKIKIKYRIQKTINFLKSHKIP